MIKWKEIETPGGILKYRLPDIAEGFDFLAVIERISCAQDVFKIKGNFSRMMGPMIDYNGLGYASYDEFLRDRENNTAAMAAIADEFFIEITRALGKKNLSPMQSTLLAPVLPKPSLLSLLKVMMKKKESLNQE